MRIRGVAAACALTMIAAMHSPTPVGADIQARRAYDFVNSVGVNTHFSWTGTVYDSKYDEMKSALADLGIKHIRQNASFPVSIRRIGDLNESLGIRALMIVDNFKAKNFGARELDPGSVADQIDNAIAKLGASVFSGVEGPNEYNATLKKAGNTDWAQDLRAFATATHRAVRNNPAASALPVAAPSLAWNEKANFQELGDLSSISDLGTLHAYSGERRSAVAACQHRQSRPAGAGYGIRITDRYEEVAGPPLHRQGEGEVSRPLDGGVVRQAGSETRFHLPAHRHEPEFRAR